MANGWKMTRRLFFAIARTMGGFKGSEESLWPIQGDRKESVTIEKIELWKQRLKELGKWRSMS